MDEIDIDDPSLFNTMIAFLLYVDEVVLLSKTGVSLQRLLSKLYEFCTSSSLEVDLSKTKNMVFGHNKRKLKQEACYINPIKITHKYEYLALIFVLMFTLIHLVKKQRIACIKALMDTLRIEAIV